MALLLLFGGLFAPLAEVKLGIGGTTYEDFIASVHLPRQLALVDPIVASFTGGAVGSISAFFAIEIQNFKEQEKKLCLYCKGTGYLQCAECCTSATRPGLRRPVTNARELLRHMQRHGEGDVLVVPLHGRRHRHRARPRIDPFD